MVRNGGERLDMWPRNTMENLAKQLAADEQEGEKIIVAISLQSDRIPDSLGGDGDEGLLWSSLITLYLKPYWGVVGKAGYMA